MSSDCPYLPYDLIYIIIGMTDDVQTLKRWCLATRFNKGLHPIALKQRWTTTELTWPDVVGWPADERTFWLEDAIYPTLLNGQLIYPAPASLIHRLVLSFGADLLIQSNSRILKLVKTIFSSRFSLAAAV